MLGDIAWWVFNHNPWCFHVNIHELTNLAQFVGHWHVYFKEQMVCELSERSGRSDELQEALPYIFIMTQY